MNRWKTMEYLRNACGWWRLCWHSTWQIPSAIALPANILRADLMMLPLFNLEKRPEPWDFSETEFAFTAPGATIETKLVYWL